MNTYVVQYRDPEVRRLHPAGEFTASSPENAILDACKFLIRNGVPFFEIVATPA